MTLDLESLETHGKVRQGLLVLVRRYGDRIILKLIPIPTTAGRISIRGRQYDKDHSTESLGKRRLNSVVELRPPFL